MSRRQRQHDELCRLCRSGALARAIDLAYEHFAEFGRDESLLALLVGTYEREGASPVLRRRLGELQRLNRTPLDEVDQPGSARRAQPDRSA